MPPRLTAAALHAALLAADSATAVLERICGQPVTIRRLAAGDAMPACLTDPHMQHRRVTLVCGARVLSLADLWFVPACLPAPMRAALATTDIPFGRVVHGLGLRRRTLHARICAPGEPFALDHRAVLGTAEGPVAEVWERYAWALVEGPS